jgi:mannose-6-phosphate isomerase-like protein (cupin superfamily)
MRDTSITKVDSAFSPIGAMGQRYLAAGVHVSMRLWEEEPPSSSSPAAHSRRDYEVVGFVLSGRAALEIEGQTVLLEPGDSYVVPRGALHKYTVFESFSAVEATAPPAFIHARDEKNLSNPALPTQMPLSEEDLAGS